MAFALLFGLPGAARSAESDELLARVLSAVASQPLTGAPFFERRMSALFSRPLESRGTLSYRPPGILEKSTTAPIREKVTISADSIAIQSDESKPPKVIKLDSQPTLQGYIQSLRAIMAGDAKPIQKYFDAQMSGSFDKWTLRLLPVEAGMRRAVKQIVVNGARGQVQVVETTESGGDVNELSLLVR